MIKTFLLVVLVALAIAPSALGQNSNSSTTVRPRTTNSNQSQTTPARATDTTNPATKPPVVRTTPNKPAVTMKASPGAGAVTTAFNTLLEGIRRADVSLATSVYWNSPRLILFNNNGTVTKGWEQMHSNRESSYPEVKDVKLDIRDLSISMLGRDGAVVTCLWTQSQSYRGTPESASGRMTLVFKRIGKEWRAIHLHTSPDAPDPSRVLPSEQAPATQSSPTP